MYIRFVFNYRRTIKSIVKITLHLVLWSKETLCMLCKLPYRRLFVNWKERDSQYCLGRKIGLGFQSETASVVAAKCQVLERETWCQGAVSARVQVFWASGVIRWTSEYLHELKEVGHGTTTIFFLFFLACPLVSLPPSADTGAQLFNCPTDAPFACTVRIIWQSWYLFKCRPYDNDKAMLALEWKCFEHHPSKDFCYANARAPSTTLNNNKFMAKKNKKTRLTT